MTQFVGGSGTAFSASTTMTPLTFSTPTATAEQPSASLGSSPQAHVDRGLTDWLQSQEAIQYQSKWVLLDNMLAVIDCDESPSALLARHAQEASHTIVFVESRGVQFAV